MKHWSKMTASIRPLFHEWNWWSCYPDPNDKPKYKNTQLLPTWLDTLARHARQNGQEELLPIYRQQFSVAAGPFPEGRI